MGESSAPPPRLPKQNKGLTMLYAIAALLFLLV